MMEAFNYTKWFLLVLPMVLSAGPANITCASLGANQGIKRAVPFLCGLAIPAITYSLLIGYGANTVVSRYPFIIDFVQYAGAAYVLYLAVRFLLAGAKSSNINDNPPHLGFRSGFILSALNGKLITMLILMYSVMLDGTSSYGIVWLMTILLFITGISSNILWMIGGQLLSKVFVSPRAIRIQNVAFGLMLLVVAVWIVV